MRPPLDKVPKTVWRTYRVYFDIEVEDKNPDDPEREWEPLNEALKSFYNMVDDGAEPDITEITD